MSKVHAAITAVGGYVPEKVLTNFDLEKMVDTNDEWITTRTGIKERRLLKENGKGTSYLAIKAAQNLIEKANLDPKEIDLVIMATATPDMPVASTGVYVATQIGATNAFAFDLHAACSSFLYGMSTASAYIQSGKYKKVLLIGADKMSSIIDYTDRATCIIFGDGGGAVLFEPNEEGLGLQDEYLRSDGIGREYLKIDAGGSILPPSEETVKNGQHFVFQDGKTVFKYAVTNMASVKDINLKTAKDAGFRNAFAVGFMPNQRISMGYYTIEVYAGDKLNGNSYILQNLKDVERNKDNGVFYYTYGKVYTLEDAVKLQKELEAKGVKNTVIQKVYK